MKARKFIPLLVIAAGLLAYHNSFTGPFLFDDIPSIRENPTIRHLWPIWDALSPPRWGGATVEGRPLINLSFAINYALGGTKVWGYHALNLAIHILAGLTLLGIVRRTLVQPKLRERFGAVANELALAVAVIWTVHPLQTESVTYMVQRAESITGLFYLLTLYCFIRGAESQRARPWYGLCAGACALGMASKEVMVSAPLMVMLYDRAFVSGSFPEACRRRWPLYLALASTWILLGCLMVFTGSFNNFTVITESQGIARWPYLLTEPGVILHYLRLSVWPDPLCFDYYGWPMARTWMSILVPALVVAILLGTTAWACKINSAWGFLGAWFFLILAPSSSFIPLDSPAFEHRMYLPLAAVVTLVVMRFYSLAGRRSLAVFVLAAMGLGVLTVRRNEDYRSQFALWNDTAMKWPENPRAHDSLGVALVHLGRLPEAMTQWEQALRLKPDYPEAHYNLGKGLAQLGRVPEAIGHYEEALRLKPDYAEVHYSLGVTLGQVGRLEEAIGHLERVLQIHSDFSDAHCSLGRVLVRMGRVQEGIGHYEQALRLKPDYPEAEDNLAWLLATLSPADGGDPVQAVTLAQGACKLTDNRLVPYLDTLAVAYAAAGQFTNAITTSQSAIALARSDGQTNLIEELNRHLELFRNGNVYRESTH